MTVIVEDGSGVVNANSYVSETEVMEYASARGVALSAGTLLQAHIVKAGDYLQTWERAFVGYRRERHDLQRMSWPRVGAFVDDYTVESDTIPGVLKDCQCELVIDIHSGIDIHNRAFRAPRKRVKAGGVEVENAVMNSVVREVSSQAMELLRRLVVTGGVPLTPSYSGEIASQRGF